MLIGIVAAGLASPGSTGAWPPSFFEGAGYAYHHVISLIVAASTFAEGVRLSGLIAARDPGDRALARPRDGRRDGGALVPGRRLGDRDRAGGRRHGVLRPGRRLDGARPRPARDRLGPGRPLRPDHEPGRRRGDGLLRPWRTPGPSS